MKTEVDTDGRVAALRLTPRELRVLLHFCVGGAWEDPDLEHAYLELSDLFCRGLIRRAHNGIGSFLFRIGREYEDLLPALQELAEAHRALDSEPPADRPRYYDRRKDYRYVR